MKQGYSALAPISHACATDNKWHRNQMQLFVDLGVQRPPHTKIYKPLHLVLYSLVTHGRRRQPTTHLA